MTEKSIDLNDLVQSVHFNVLGDKFEIPPMNDVKMKKVMGLSKKITTLSKTENDESLTDEEEAELLDCQNTILHECVSKIDGKNLKQIDQEEFGNWPIRLKNRVLELVFSQIGSGEEDKDSEKN